MSLNNINYFRNSANPNVSKAIIDLELNGKDGREGVESKIATHLTLFGTLGTVPATPENLMVKENEGN